MDRDGWTGMKIEGRERETRQVERGVSLNRLVYKFKLDRVRFSLVGEQPEGVSLFCHPVRPSQTQDVTSRETCILGFSIRKPSQVGNKEA